MLLTSQSKNYAIVSKSTLEVTYNLNDTIL